MEFLMKMNPKYQHIRSNILMMKELPSAAEAYRILMQKQTHQEQSKKSMNENQETPIACRVDKRKHGEKEKFIQNKRGSYYCDHYKMYGHSMESCWKIHGYPTNYIPNTWKKEGSNKVSVVQGHSTHANSNAEPKLTQEQYNKLMCLLSKHTSQTEEKDHSIAASAHHEGAFDEAFASW
ncbi:uncharacterized protein LOC130811022 [Amaranthus tricolor]|uniref:uncharacterized protein LOC130811022 n=1 Tax=Amaranthus tricolor TaxID=29722 RepID=UPI0025894A70|nr:uncharacterized protein LOC130811022 [Amaranthus tricolor]